ncbi:DUF1325-domain-containing protein [Fistulina hepatica ATCC 64428]|nr:DUF1325-domain-containing protein [Fistulina hepatica ATCC 64428]
MDRRKYTSRPPSSEEIQYWAQAASTLNALSEVYGTRHTEETIGRVNRLISGWPMDDEVPAQGYDGAKGIAKKLVSGLDEIRTTSEREVKAFDEAIERLDVLIALRRAPSESLLIEKRNKRPRGLSPGGHAGSSPAPTANGRTLVIPARDSARPSPVPPTGRDKSRQSVPKQPPIPVGSKVAFHPPKSSNPASTEDPNAWILASVIRARDKNRYDVQDVEPQEDGKPGRTYNTTSRAMVPLPDPNATSFPQFAVGSTVLALYPDTSCFYRAEVVATPRDMQPPGKNNPKAMPTYKLKFDDDDNQEHAVTAQWVVTWPG